jgi:pimeloyl-ACP methyl ester carboxylesterase
MTSILRALMIAAAVGGSAPAADSEAVAFRAADARLLYGDLYGTGDRGVVILAHGGYSTRASWKPAADALAAAQFRVLVFESRGAADFAAGKETPCLSDDVCQSKDVVAAIRHLQRLGVKTISLIGGSLGGAAVALAAIDAGPRTVESLVLMAPAAVAAPEKIPGRKLFVTARSDANSAGLRLPGIQAQYARARPQKELMLIDGSAHGQNILATPQGAAVLQHIGRFLAGTKR